MRQNIWNTMGIFPAILALLFFVHSVSAEESAAKVPEQKYKRRVLLTLFINENHDKNTEYLSATIAEAFDKPLTKTGNFTVLNRDSIERYMRTMGIALHEVYQTENAVRLGRAVGADVVVVGKFITKGQKVTIEAKAIDVQAGRLSVEDQATVRTNSLMFDAINELARKMSVPMAEKMQQMETPPPPAEVILDEKQVATEVKKIEEKKAQEAPPSPPTKKIFFTVRAGGGLAISLGYTRSVYPLGFGAMIGGEVLGLSTLFFKQAWLEKFEVGLFSGYLIYPPKHSSYGTLSQLPLHATIGYRFSLPYFGGIAVTPFISGGFHFGKFSNTNGVANYRLPGLSFGGRAQYAISQRLALSLTVMGMMEIDQGVNFLWQNFLSVAYTFE